MIAALTELLGYFYQIGHFTQLEAIARTVLTTIPDDTVSLHFLGLAYLRTGRASDAARLFRKRCKGIAEAASPTIDTPHQETQTAADACYRATTDLNPEFADTWYEMAMEMRALGLREPAMSVLHYAVAARPDFKEARAMLTELGLESGDAIAATESSRQTKHFR